MGRRRADNTLETFNRKNIQDGITYAEAQIRETQSGIGRIRAPRGYMTTSGWNALKSAERK